ncbi:hypothetical protein HPB51_004621 [Rhipicephalus microplus]|uniref:Uncharacterized protein n=1 Tax=Rhipicephalus microplus TaxID=6941 RepID=A0A9J6DF95_RHIMP|nr:hypothetical protein HPB51_004621 [Rhipicephalus microplus]
MAYMSVLCSHLLGLPEDQLQRLDDERGLPLSKIRGKSIQKAVKSIRVHLTNMPTLRRHLETVAHIYCFLVEQGAIQPWTLYRIPERGDHARLVGGVLDSFVRRGTGCWTEITPTFTCTCFMTSDEVGWMVHKPSFFCVWTEPSCVAVHEPPPGRSLAVSRVLFRILGTQPQSFQCGTYRDLNEARDAARRLIR